MASVSPIFHPANLQATGFFIPRRQWERHTYLVGCYIENELGPVVNWSLVDKENCLLAMENAAPSTTPK